MQVGMRWVGIWFVLCLLVAPAASAGPFDQGSYLKASLSGAGDQFGYSVAVSGDTMVVGAPGEDSNATGVDGNQTDNSATGSGAVYVFTRSGGSWSQQAYLKASNTGAGDEFGYSVAVAGDTITVGARWEASNATGVNGNQADNSAADSGATYVFTRSGGSWSQQAYLKASNTDSGDRFGYSVAIAGDTITVGAPFEDSNATGVDGNQADNSVAQSGAVFVFTRSGGSWSQQAYLKASNTDVDDRFGWSVAVAGDTIVVGAFDESSNATGVDGNQTDHSAGGSGAVYVFTRSGGIWSQQAYLKASNTDSGDHFGQSVAISGDTIAVGALLEASNATGVDGNQADNSAIFSGAVYVFTRNGTTWSQEAYLKASNTDAFDLFGYSVAVSGDTITVGAPGESSNATGVDGNQANNSAGNSGAVYVFTRNGTTWSQEAYLKASNTDIFDQFGAVAISGDTITVGAPVEASSATGVDGNQADNSAFQSGAVYVFEPDSAPHVPVTLTVDDDLVQCPTAGYTSIQAAVNAAGPGDTINVCRGTYNEQVQVDLGKDDLRIWSSTAPQAAVVKGGFSVDGAQAIEIERFRIEPAPGDAGIGVGGTFGGDLSLVRSNLVVGGAFGLVVGANVGLARDNSFLNQTDAGIYVVASLGPAGAVLQNNTVTGPGTGTGNTVGIWFQSLGDTATGTAFGNTVARNAGGGIRIDSGPVTLKANTVSLNGTAGIQIDGAPGNQIENNKVGSNTGPGIKVNSGGNTLLSNNAKGNTGTDCLDTTTGTGTGGTDNTWTGNYGLDWNPPGICKK